MNTLAAMPKYEAYNDSGYEWIGEIPVGWELTKLGSTLKPVSIKNRPYLPLLSITREQGVILRDIENPEENHNFIPDDLSGYKLLEKGQFGMNKMKAWQGSYGVSDYTGIVSPAYFIFNFTKPIFPDYFHKAIRSKLYVSFFGSASDGVRIGQWDLSKPRMKEIPFLVPPLAEQTAIANFLDRKSAQIDQAIAIKEKQTELLKERKQILIQNAVTRGLDPNVEMKDSGVGWTGEMPEHWNVKRLAAFGGFSKGGGFSKSDLTEKGISAILYGDIYTQYQFIINNAVRNIPSKVAENSIAIHRDDLLFTGSGETKEDIGKCVVYDGSHKAVAGGDIIIFRQRENNVLFLAFCLNSHGIKEEKAKSSKGEIIVHTYASKLRNLYIPIPPIEEQENIVEYIKNEFSKVDKAIELQQQQIEKIKEYKSTLINSAVTGKIKVA